MKGLNLAGLLAAPVFLLVTAGARAEMIPWTADLTTDQETQELADVTGDEHGSASGALDTDTGELSWDLLWSDLTGPAFAAHFHDGAPGVAGPIEVPIFVLDMGEGTASGENTGSATIDSTQMDELLGGDWYVNVHTPSNPMGEIRGQVMTGDGVVNVPEPGSIMLLSVGLLAVLFVRRRRV